MKTLVRRVAFGLLMVPLILGGLILPLLPAAVFCLVTNCQPPMPYQEVVIFGTVGAVLSFVSIMKLKRKAEKEKQAKSQEEGEARRLAAGLQRHAEEEQAKQLEAERQAQIREEQAGQGQQTAKQKREEELLQRMEDLNDLLWTWTAEQGMELPFGMKSIDEVAKDLRKLYADANPILKERYAAYAAGAKERAKRRYEARFEVERQKELQADLWQGTKGPPKPGSNWIRDTWPNEARDFTPWLAEHLELVSACTGWDLRFEGREVYAAGGRVDIVARENKSKSKVVIENQLDSADFDHWRQLVFYGDTLNARIRIWIAADFSPNIRRDVRNQNRQNESRSGGAIYYLLKLRPDRSSPISLAVGPTNSQAHLDFTNVPLWAGDFSVR